MIHGAHIIIYSENAEADRVFFREVLKYPSADAGGGWLIFALPPAELAVHPSSSNGKHELYLMGDDMDTFLTEMKKRRVPCGPVHELRWGVVTTLTLPGGGKLGVYEPKHDSPITPKKKTTRPKKASPKTTTRKAASSKTAKGRVSRR